MSDVPATWPDFPGLGSCRLGQELIVDESTREARAHVAEAQVPNRPDSAPAARSFLSRLLKGWGVSEQVIDDASLLTSELMANAVQHGAGFVDLKIELVDGKLYVGVHDDADQTPEVVQADATSAGGRGMWIVQSVAHHWGTESRGGNSGKTVWFELTLLQEPAPED